MGGGRKAGPGSSAGMVGRYGKPLEAARTWCGGGRELVQASCANRRPAACLKTNANQTTQQENHRAETRRQPSGELQRSVNQATKAPAPAITRRSIARLWGRHGLVRPLF